MNSEAGSQLFIRQRVTRKAQQLVQSATHEGKSYLLRLQALFRCEPRGTCLISGTPRSGTTAMSRWLGQQPGTLSYTESRQLIAVHRFIQEVHRFKRLRPRREAMCRQMRFIVYGTRYPDRRVWQRMWIEKEPLGPIAFPDKDYEAFIENVRIVWPEMKILFMIRDPIACIWSKVQRPWGYSVEDTELHHLPLDEHIENWKACARLVAKYHADENTYVCQFERLVQSPVAESNRIGAFLSVSPTAPFTPQPTKAVGFSDEEKERIWEEVGQEVEQLETLGLIDVPWST